MGKFNKTHSALRRFLLLDFGIVLAMLVFSIPMYGKILDSARHEAVRESTRQVEQAIEEINNLVFNLLNTQSTLTAEQNIGKLALLNDQEIETATYYTMRSARQTMKMAFSSYDDVDEAIVLYHRNQMAVSNLRVFDNREEYYEKYVECDELSDEQLDKLLQQGFSRVTLLPSIPMTLGGETVSQQRMVLLLPMRKDSSALCIFINTQRLISRFAVKDQHEDVWIRIDSTKGEQVYSHNVPQNRTEGKYLLIEQPISF